MDTKSDITLITVAQALLTICTEMRKFISDSIETADDNSMFLNDVQTYGKTESILTLLGQGNLALRAATEHLGATALLIQDGNYSMAVWACAKGAMESSALAAWLFDPTVDTKERVGRTFAYRYEGLDQLRRFCNAEGGTEEARKMEAQINKMASEAVALGFMPLMDKKGKRIGIATKMPEITNLIKDMFGSAAIYRILSQAVHMATSALRQLNYNPEVQKAVIDDGLGGSEAFILERELQLEAVCMVCYTAVQAYAKANWRRAELLGLDRVAVAKIFDRAYDDLRINKKLRFWATK